jgi:methionyl-tRNA formyltransferase
VKVLLLGPRCTEIGALFDVFGDTLLRTEAPIGPGDALLGEVDMLVSFGYRHILGADLLALFPGRAINLHIALLPWNRGADPNLWSFLEDTPKGVTIHLLDAGIDTGAILAQRPVAMEPGDTLGTSYQRLRAAMLALFAERWGALREGALREGALGGQSQQGPGSFHRARERDRFAHLLTLNWDTPVATLIGKAHTTKGEPRQ